MIKFLLLPVFLLTLSMARLCQSVQNKRSLKHIWQFIVENYSTVASIKAHDFNFVQLGISPVEFLFVEINGYAIRPSHRCVHQSNTITTIQFCSFNLWMFIPISPEHIPARETGFRFSLYKPEKRGYKRGFGQSKINVN